jgi:hypothetical protein
MSDYGLQVWDSAGNEIYNSLTRQGGWVCNVVQGQTTEQVFSFPMFAGLTGMTFQQGGSVIPYWDYALGYPRVTIPAFPYADDFRATYINMVK